MFDSCPRAVGLLFAGGSSDTFANPIAKVLTRLHVSMVGCPTAAVSVAAAAAAPLVTAAHKVSAQSFSACRTAKETAEPDVLAIPGVVGMGIGISDTEPEQAAVEIYTSDDPSSVRVKLPRLLSSVPSRSSGTGTIHAL